MERIQGISDTEMEIMEYLWKRGEAVSTVDLLAYFNSERNKSWKLQTLSTFLARLSNKGFLKSETRGRGTAHQPAFSQEEYHRLKAKSILEIMYEGSIKNFFAALYGDKKLSKEEIAELKQWLSER
jgi:BlaI family transcriptional regulator, penicillinase repressor